MNEKSLGMRLARLLAVVIIVGVASAAFVLSFAALRGLGVEAHVEARLAWLLPVVVDGTIVLATVGWLVMANQPQHRRYFLAMLASGAAVSVAGNSLHAIAAGHLLPGWACALVAAIAPISLLADTHGLAVLFRAAQQDSAPTTTAAPAPVPVAAAAPVKAAPARRAPARRDPAKVARAVALRAEGNSYTQIGKALGVSPRTAASYARKPVGEIPAPAPVAERELRPVPAPRPAVRPAPRAVAEPMMLPVAVPVGGGR